MTLVYRKASRKQAKLRLGLSAGPGWGKTMGALLLGYGIMRAKYPDTRDDQLWDKIGIIDTEEGSGELYVGAHKHGVTFGEYGYIRLSKPFTPAKYIDAQTMMEKQGVEVIIHDSLTHAWAGAGGLLEKQGRLTDADPRKNSYTAWRHVTPEHNALVDSLLQSPAHIIGTMRSKTEYAMQNGVNGKQQVVKLGMAPIQREGMEFEFTAFFDIDEHKVARATKDRTDLFCVPTATGFIERREFVLTPAVGAELWGWLNKGLESIEQVAERLAGNVAVATDLERCWAMFQPEILRIESEHPDWMELVRSLFEQRSKELLTERK